MAQEACRETEEDLLPREAAEALLRGEHGDPFSVLGLHYEGGRWLLRCYQPGAQRVELIDALSGATLGELRPLQWQGLFAACLDHAPRYRLRLYRPHSVEEIDDPYCFGPALAEAELQRFRRGDYRAVTRCLGAVPGQLEKVPGVRFAVWAPNARRVSLVGDFNDWDGRRHPMRWRHGAGVWEIFMPRLPAGSRYKYEILGRQGLLPLRADPVARQTEMPPATASLVAEPLRYHWQDGEWLARRHSRQHDREPLAIYELHLGSWRRKDDGGVYHWQALAGQLIPYVKALGFTHVELMPIMEHPFGGSWGYQVLSQFAPSARYGDPRGLAEFVDACHGAGLGVILDWVPGHFPTDEHGLARFDGTALYEHAHPFEGFHPDWDTYIYDLGRTEVRAFLLASAMYWLREFHIDGLRVDAVASMLYRDYSRVDGEWIPNCHGGRENLEAIAFLQQLNDTVADQAPGALVMAEESTAFPGVSSPTHKGGLGFSYKWNMGWMNDSLRYFQQPPSQRRHHHHRLSFGLSYAFNERFILPISHDEVVHGKGSLLEKMPGDRWQKFANLRLLLSFMWTHPGKKLLFMGAEFAAPCEWNHDEALPWERLQQAEHQGVHTLLRDLNGLYLQQAPLHELDLCAEGFQWLIGDDDANSVFAWLRWDAQRRPLLVLHHCSAQLREGYRVGVPQAGAWQVILNSDAACYGGSGQGVAMAEAVETGSHGQPVSLELQLPPLATLIMQPV